ADKGYGMGEQLRRRGEAEANTNGGVSARLMEKLAFVNPTELLGAMKRTVEQLAAFNQIAKALTSTLEVGEVLKLVMQKVSELLQPESWSLLLEAPDGQLYFEIAVGPAAERLKA